MLHYILLHMFFILAVTMYFVGSQKLYNFNKELCELNRNSIIECELYGFDE